MFNREKKAKEDQGKRLKIAGILVLILNILGGIFFLFRPKRWKKFMKGEKREIEELTTGKEDLGKFFHDSNKLIHDFFIPHDGNDHKPKALRPKSIVTYVALVIIVKLLVTGFLFISYPSPAELSAIISSNMINLINKSRVEAGVEPLQENSYLAESATVKGDDMISRDYFSHDSPEGKRPWQWINRGEYDYVYAGENLAMDFISAEVVHSAFLKSPSHRKNILNPKYQNIGIAVVSGEMNGRPTILLVEFFGTQRRDLNTLASASPTPEPTEIIEESAEPIPTEIVELDSPEIAGEEIAPSEINLEEVSPFPTNEGIIIVATNQKTSKALVDLVIEYSNIFFVAFLIFILISLALNVFVKIRVQHTSIILQSVVVVALLVSMMLVKFHFVEQVAPQLLIL